MKIRPVESPQEEAQGLKRWVFFCPACQCGHQIRTGAGQWTFNGDTDKPTIQPSILTTHYPEGFPNGKKCHSYVTNGMIQFLNDCDHGMAGKTVPLEDF